MTAESRAAMSPSRMTSQVTLSFRARSVFACRRAAGVVCRSDGSRRDVHTWEAARRPRLDANGIARPIACRARAAR